MADTHLEPFNRGDDSSPTESGTQDTTQLQTMSAQHGIDSTDEISFLHTGNTTPETKKTARQSSLDHHATIEDDIEFTPQQVVPHIEGGYRRPEMAIATSRDWSGITTKPHQVAHHGPGIVNVNVTNNQMMINNTYHAQTESRLRNKGFKFDMETSFGNGQQLSAFESAYESRAVHTSRKRPVVSL